MVGFDFQIKKNHQQFKQQFIENCLQLNRSEHTLKNYNADLDKFFKWYECHYHQKISTMNAKVISQYQQHLTKGGQYPLIKKSRGLSLKRLLKNLVGILIPYGKERRSKQAPIFVQSPLAIASQKRHLSTLKNFFEFLKQTHEEKGLFKFNPVKSKIHNIKLKESDIEHTAMIYPDQWRQLSEQAFYAEDKLILELMYYGGLRLHEVCHLQKINIDFETKTLFIQRKGGKVHRFKPFISSEIFYLSKIVMNKYPQNKFLFSKKHDRPIPLTTMHHKIRKLCLRAGLPKQITAHSLRKACATQLYLQTKDLLRVRDYLNHTDAKVTQTYIDQKSLHQHALIN